MNKIDPLKKSKRLEEQQNDNKDSEELYCTINPITKSPFHVN